MSSAAEAESLLDAMRLFLRRHEEALASGDPRRGHEACGGLVDAIATTLPEEIARLPPLHERERMARAVLEKRMAETEGLALQLRLAFEALERRDVDILRLVALLTALRRTLRALDQTLVLWAAEHSAPREAAIDAFEALRAARECLLAQLPGAASAALAPALCAALARPLGLAPDTPAATSLARWEQGQPRFDVAAARALDATLSKGAADPVAAWALLDAVESLAHQAAMSPPPASGSL